MIDTHKNSILAKQCIIYPRQAEILNCSKAKLYKYQIKHADFSLLDFQLLKLAFPPTNLQLR